MYFLALIRLALSHAKTNAEITTPIKQANSEASSIIKSANKEIEKTIRVIKESSANKGKTDKVRKTLNQKVA